MKIASEPGGCSQQRTIRANFPTQPVHDLARGQDVQLRFKVLKQNQANVEGFRNFPASMEIVLKIDNLVCLAVI